MAGTVRVVAPSWLARLPATLTIDGAPAAFGVAITARGEVADIALSLDLSLADTEIHAVVRCRAPIAAGLETMVGSAGSGS